MKNSKRGFVSRKVSVVDRFLFKCNEFTENSYKVDNANKVFNVPFEKIVKNENVLENVDLIYADPPYTDMQYS